MATNHRRERARAKYIDPAQAQPESSPVDSVSVEETAAADLAPLPQPQANVLMTRGGITAEVANNDSVRVMRAQGWAIATA